MMYTSNFSYLMMMMHCFCSMVDRRKTLSLISSRDHCQRLSPWRISNRPRAGFKSVQNLGPDLVEWSWAVVTTNFNLVFYILFSLENVMLSSTYFAFFLMGAPLERAPLLKGRKLNEGPLNGAHSDNYGILKNVLTLCVFIISHLRV